MWGLDEFLLHKEPSKTPGTEGICAHMRMRTHTHTHTHTHTLRHLGWINPGCFGYMWESWDLMGRELRQPSHAAQQREASCSLEKFVRDWQAKVVKSALHAESAKYKQLQPVKTSDPAIVRYLQKSYPHRKPPGQRVCTWHGSKAILAETFIFLLHALPDFALEILTRDLPWTHFRSTGGHFLHSPLDKHSSKHQKKQTDRRPEKTKMEEMACFPN